MNPATPTQKPQPWLTYAILCLLALGFGIEVLLAPTLSFSPDTKTLLLLGALTRDTVVADHEWYRLLTAPFLHANPLHLLMNGLALYLVLPFLELFIGRRWSLSLLLTGALGGSLLSLAINATGTISVGASGAIMGLFAAVLVLSFRFPKGPDRRQLLTQALQALVPSLLPLFTSGSFQVDYGAHLGGTLAGALTGFVLLKTWRTDNPRPANNFTATVFSGLSVLLFALSLGFSGFTCWQEYQIAQILIPDNQIPKTPDQAFQTAPTLVATYPKDPRAYFEQGLAFLMTKDNAAAIGSFQQALTLYPPVAHKLGHAPERGIRLLLTQTLVLEKRTDEAKEVFKPLCAEPPSPWTKQKKVIALKEMHFCEE